MSKKTNDRSATALLIAAAFGFLRVLVKYPTLTIIGLNLLVVAYSPDNSVVVFFVSVAAGLIYCFYERLKTQAAQIERNKKIEEKYGTRIINQSTPLIERHQDIIQKHLSNLRSSAGYYTAENETRDCIIAIALAEGKKQFSPTSGEYLRNWSSRNSLPQEWLDLKEHILKRFGAKLRELELQKLKTKNIKVEEAGQNILKRNKELVDKFLEITERKVSVIDDYGDENWQVLPIEILTCLKKIAQKEGLSLDFEQYFKKRRSNFFPSQVPDEYVWLQKELEEIFKQYHQIQKSNSANGVDLKNLSGVEFEIWVSKILKENGFVDVRGTPATGDQGADLIAKKDGKTIVIQAKRYKGSVGNKAVQEVIGAVQFYAGDVGWVITNSTFTPAAKDLAYKSNVKLIDGKMLEDVGKHLH